MTERPAPPQAVERSLATEGLLAHVVVSKYVDHLPLYRQERILGREGLDLSRTTLCGWVADVATALAPNRGRAPTPGRGRDSPAASSRRTRPTPAPRR